MKEIFEITNPFGPVSYQNTRINKKPTLLQKTMHLQSLFYLNLKNLGLENENDQLTVDTLSSTLKFLKLQKLQIQVRQKVNQQRQNSRSRSKNRALSALKKTFNQSPRLDHLKQRSCHPGNLSTSRIKGRESIKSRVKLKNLSVKKSLSRQIISDRKSNRTFIGFNNEKKNNNDTNISHDSNPHIDIYSKIGKTSFERNNDKRSIKQMNRNLKIQSQRDISESRLNNRAINKDKINGVLKSNTNLNSRKESSYQRRPLVDVESDYLATSSFSKESNQPLSSKFQSKKQEFMILRDTYINTNTTLEDSINNNYVHKGNTIKQHSRSISKENIAMKNIDRQIVKQIKGGVKENLMKYFSSDKKRIIVPVVSLSKNGSSFCRKNSIKRTGRRNKGVQGEKRDNSIVKINTGNNSLVNLISNNRKRREKMRRMKSKSYISNF